MGGKIGCHPLMFNVLTGMGDLIVTCTSMHSRINMCGFYIGKGDNAKESVSSVGMVVEGIKAIPVALSIDGMYKVYIPILNTVVKVVKKGESTKNVVVELFRRDMKCENMIIINKKRNRR